MGKLLLLSICDRAIDLVVVVVQAGDVCTSELGDLTSRSTDTASNIKHHLTLLNTNLVCKVVLMAGNGLVEWLANGEAAEVEGLTPAELVNVGGKVVVAVEGSTFKSAGVAENRIGRIKKGPGENTDCLVKVAY